MGTSIDVLFPRPCDVTASNLAKRLALAVSATASSLLTIQEHAWYTIEHGDWHVLTVPADGAEPEYVTANGPYGFDIALYEQVCLLGHLDRFRRLHATDSPVSLALQDVVQHIVRTLAGKTFFACVAGGMGDSDRACDLAYYQAASFNDVCELLQTKLGQPATAWSELQERRWILASTE